MDVQAISIEPGHTTYVTQQSSGEAGNLWVLIPVKALASAKQRLKDCLGLHREAFTLAMLADVLAALADSKSIAGIVVVTPDRRVAGIATGKGLEVVEESGSAGLNAAIEQGVTAVRGLGGARVIILPSDIPLLTGAELDRLIAAFDRQAGKTDNSAIAISPAGAGGGTNCLVLNINQAFTFQYGPDSYMIHSENARAAQREVISIQSPTIALDIDQPQQVRELLDFCEQHPEFQKTQTWKFLHDTMHIDRKTERT